LWYLHVTDHQVDATEYSENVISDPMSYSYDYESPMGTYLIAQLPLQLLLITECACFNLVDRFSRSCFFVSAIS
jgi:hypothetical protein